MQLLNKANSYSASSHAESTKRAYALGWKDFHSWCERLGREALPCTEETVSLYVVSQLQEGLKLSTVQQRVAAIAFEQRRAGFSLRLDGQIREVVRGAKREKGTRSEGKTALAAEDLRRMCRALQKVSSTEAKQQQATRDRALLVLGFAAAMRVSELVGLDLADVQIVRKGLLVTIRRSKTDQEGEGRQVGIFPGSRACSCPVRALKAWLKVRGRKPGALFRGPYGSDRLTTRGALFVLKRACVLVGLEPELYGTHSLRVGFVTAAAEAGQSEAAIMQRTGHRSVQMVARYVRPTSAFAVDVLRKCL